MLCLPFLPWVLFDAADPCWILKASVCPSASFPIHSALNLTIELGQFIIETHRIQDPNSHNNWMKKDYIRSPLVSLFGLNSEDVQVPRTRGPEAETQFSPQPAFSKKNVRVPNFGSGSAKSCQRERSFGRAGDEIQKNLFGSGTDAWE